MSKPPSRLLKPPPLMRGDAVAIVAPASAPPDPASIDRAAEAVENAGYTPVLGRYVRNRHGFLAGSDRDRAGDLLRMFSNKRIGAIICVRGGYGTARLLSRLDYSLIRNHPKILVGYSDITALHCALLTAAGLVSFHGPMLCSDLIKPGVPEFTTKSFLAAVSGEPVPRSLCAAKHGQSLRTLRNGKASGRLVGGNLSVLCTTIGTPWQPPFKNSILFLEEVDEVPYRLDRMLTHLLNAGLLQQVRGIALGTFKGCYDPKAAAAKEYRQTVEDVLSERLLSLQVPLVVGLPFGHATFNATLPIGCRVTLDADRGELVLCETPVA